MAAGLGFKDFVTGEVLTAADVDGYLMQGIWVFANATARNSAVTSPQEGNSCYLKDTDVIQVYDGSNWVTKSASGTSGGMTLISTTTLTGASVTLSSIPGTYKDLQLIFRSVRPQTDNTPLSIRINSDTSSSRYLTTSSQDNGNQNFPDNLWTSSNGMDNTASTGMAVMTIYDYANTATFKIATGFYAFVNATTTANMAYSFFRHAYNQTGAITSLDLFPASGDWSAGTVLLYGVS